MFSRLQPPECTLQPPAVRERLRVEGSGEDEHAGDADERGEGSRGDHGDKVDLDRIAGVLGVLQHARSQW